MDEQPSSNVNASELDEETKEKLKGDMIGDTLYSQSFVINTLLSFSDLKCTEEMEQDLMFLWDMSMEKDVCKYLFELNYPSLASAALISCTDGRFIELLIGILANIFLCDCEKTISDEEIKIVMNELDTTDPLVLLQIMRFIEALAYMMPERKHLFDKEIIEDRIQFILLNSENSELIIHTMRALVRLTEDFKLDEELVTSELYRAVVEGFDTIFSVQTNNFEAGIDTEETRKGIEIFLNLVTNICVYSQRFHKDDDIGPAISSDGKVAIIICKIIKHFSAEKELFPIISNFNNLICAFQTIITTRNVTLVQNLENQFFANTFTSLCKILCHLNNCKSEVLDSFEIVLELIGWIVFLVDQEAVLCELKELRYRRGIVVLNSLKESSRTFEFNITEKLRFLFSEFK